MVKNFMAEAASTEAVGFTAEAALTVVAGFMAAVATEADTVKHA
jgi:hypothetical protein